MASIWWLAAEPLQGFETEGVFLSIFQANLSDFSRHTRQDSGIQSQG